MALLPEQTPILLFQLLYLFIAFFYCITNRFHITATPLRLYRFAGNTPYAARLYHVRERNKEECISLCLFGAWRLYTASRNLFFGFSFLNQHSSFFILHSPRNAEPLFGRARDTEHRPWAVGAAPGSHKLTTIQLGEQSQSLYTQRCLTGSVQCHIYPPTFED